MDRQRLGVHFSNSLSEKERILNEKRKRKELNSQAPNEFHSFPYLFHLVPGVNTKGKGSIPGSPRKRDVAVGQEVSNLRNSSGSQSPCLSLKVPWPLVPGLTRGCNQMVDRVSPEQRLGPISNPDRSFLPGI